MRKVLMIGAAILLAPAIVVGIVGSNEKKQPQDQLDRTPEVPSEMIEAAKKALEAERQVESVFLDEEETGEWQIAMVNDGSSRIGYANYVCEVLHESGAAVEGYCCEDRRCCQPAGFSTANVICAAWGRLSCEDRRTISEGDLTPIGAN